VGRLDEPVEEVPLVPLPARPVLVDHFEVERGGEVGGEGVEEEGAGGVLRDEGGRAEGQGSELGAAGRAGRVSAQDFIDGLERGFRGDHWVRRGVRIALVGDLDDIWRRLRPASLLRASSQPAGDGRLRAAQYSQGGSFIGVALQ
jgi:hypothetical protein